MTRHPALYYVLTAVLCFAAGSGAAAWWEVIVHA